MVSDQKNEISELNATVDDQVNRGLRSTLIFKGIPEQTKESWSDTTNILINTLATLFDWDPNTLTSDIERAHRGTREGKNTNKPRPIYVKFHSWRSSEDIKIMVIEANRKKKTKIIVSQMYSRRVTESMNDKLKQRKELLETNGNWKMYVKYPGILMCRREGEGKFTP